MKIGTIETELEESKPRPRRSRLSASTSGGPGGRSGGDNDGRDGGDGGGGGRERERELPGDGINRDKSRLITGFLLLVVLMTFGGLIGAYVVIATNKAIEWAPFELPVQIWVSTSVILASSVTYELARRALARGRFPVVRRYFVATTILGGVFIASQLLVWIALVSRGFYMSGNPYAGFFYILTAAHAIHVLGGVVALGSILLRTWYPTSNSQESLYRHNLATSVGWYWHFMGVLWVALFLLLGFWK